MNRENIVFFSTEEIVAINEWQIELYGGIFGIRDWGLLESAAFAPQATFDGQLLHKTFYDLAAVYAYHFIKNHPFIDGNKRTGMTLLIAFLKNHDVTVALSKGQVVELGVSIATDAISRDELAKILRDNDTQVFN